MESVFEAFISNPALYSAGHLVGETLHTLQSFLVTELFKDTKKQVVEVSLERGIRVLSGPLDSTLMGLVGEDSDGVNLLSSLHALENQMRSHQSTAVIVPYADACCPRATPALWRSKTAKPTWPFTAGRWTKP